MNLLTIFSKFPDQEACIEHLENIRWADAPYCPLCGATAVARKADSQRVGRWNCHACKGRFNVLSGTIFEKTKLPLQKWFLAIGLIVNAKKSVSSHQLARDLDLNQKSAWFMQQRIRAAMLTNEGELLQGIVEADETYVGGKPRKGNRRNNNPDDWGSGRGKTEKVQVVGMVERGGRVVARVAGPAGTRLKRANDLIQKVVDCSASLMITDEGSAYRSLHKIVRHAVICHKEIYADGLVHTNTIEGFWSLLKRAFYGTHHRYSGEYMPLFVAEACWKYNHRKSSDAFGSFLKDCFA